jgi:hypothetical protein
MAPSAFAQGNGLLGLRLVAPRGGAHDLGLFALATVEELMDSIFWTVELPYWLRLNWMPVTAGLLAGSLTFVAARMAFRRARFRWFLPDEENLPWGDLLNLLKERYNTSAGSEAADNLPPEELCRLLLGELASRGPGAGTAAGAAITLADADARFGGHERRTSRRRWLNPIPVTYFAPMREHALHGIIINRSTGGFALLADFDFVAGTKLVVRALDAPEGVPAINVEVRHARKAGSMWLLGCQYTQEVPWNVKVWFG